MLGEPIRQALRVDRSAQRIGEHEITVDVGGAGEVTLEQLRLTVAAQRVSKTRSILTAAAVVVGVGLIGVAIKSGSDVNRGPNRAPSGGGQ